MLCCLCLAQLSVSTLPSCIIHSHVKLKLLAISTGGNIGPGAEVTLGQTDMRTANCSLFGASQPLMFGSQSHCFASWKQPCNCSYGTNKSTTCLSSLASITQFFTPFPARSFTPLKVRAFISSLSNSSCSNHGTTSSGGKWNADRKDLISTFWLTLLVAFCLILHLSRQV